MTKLSLSENLNDLLNVISTEELTEVQGGWGWKPKKPKKHTDPKPTDPIYIMVQPPSDPGPIYIMVQPKP